MAVPETLRLYAMYIPRIHSPTTGTVDFSQSGTSLHVTQGDLAHWKQYERIRAKPGTGTVITDGTYIVNDPKTDGFIELSRPATGGTGTVTLDLYDADVYKLSMASV